MTWDECDSSWLDYYPENEFVLVPIRNEYTCDRSWLEFIADIQRPGWQTATIQPKQSIYGDPGDYAFSGIYGVPTPDDPAYAVGAPTPNAPTPPVNDIYGTPTPNVPESKAGPAVEDYGSINARLKQIDKARSENVQGIPLPEPGEPKPQKPWWTA